MAALYNHYLGHSAYLVEIIFVVVGAFLALLSIRSLALRDQAEEGLLVSFLTRFVTKQQCAVLLPVLGFAIVFAWSAWKLFVLNATDLRMDDFIVTLFGLSLILYYAGPSKLTVPKDFVVLYLMFMTITFAVIWKLYTIVAGESYYRITAYSEYYLITIPVVTLVNLFGIDARADLDFGGGLSNTIIYEHHGGMTYLGIGSGCSGLYSAGLFFSAFLAFVLVRYRNVDRYIIAAMGLGFFVTWLSNILRMVITILVGSMYGFQALAIVHSYIGIIIFVAFAALFWFLIVKWLDRVEKAPVAPQVIQPETASQ